MSLFLEAPTWVMEPQDVTGVEGEAIEIKCFADGLPKPEMKWKKETGKCLVINYYFSLI